MKVLALEVGMDTRGAERTSPLGTDRGLIVVCIFARKAGEKLPVTSQSLCLKRGATIPPPWL